jgi:tripartite-type tricarboxylate transporter receptor subunit TctC
LFFAAACAASPAGLLAQAFPQAFASKPVRVFTQFVPGSGGDASLRVVTTLVAESIGQPLVIENRAGAGGALAAEAVMRAAPDGYTILGSSSATHVFRQFLVKSMPFDPTRDFTPISQLMETVTYLVANPSVPGANLAEILQYARANPGKFSYGSSGIGTEGHLSGEQISQLSGVPLVHVPYKASAEAIQAVVGGTLPSTFVIFASMAPLARTGKVRVIAAVRDERSPRLPDVPTVREAVPGFESVSSWTGMYGPAGLPVPVLRRLNAEFVKAMKDAGVVKRLGDMGFDAIGNTPEEFAARMKTEVALAARLVKLAGIQPE